MGRCCAVQGAMSVNPPSEVRVERVEASFQYVEVRHFVSRPSDLLVLVTTIQHTHNKRKFCSHGETPPLIGRTPPLIRKTYKGPRTMGRGRGRRGGDPYHTAARMSNPIAYRPYHTLARMSNPISYRPVGAKNLRGLFVVRFYEAKTYEMGN